MDAAPPIWLPPLSHFDAKPAIIRRLPIVRVRYGTDVVNGKLEYAEHAWPRDIFDASLQEALVYLPGQFDPKLPRWALEHLIPRKRRGLILVVTGAGLVKTVEFLTGTSGSDQTYNIAADWNSTDNYVGVVSQGTSGTTGTTGTNAAGGGGGGGFASKADLSLTPGGTAAYRLRAANAGSDTSSACWFNGTSLASSSCGIRGASDAFGSSGGGGAITTNAVGDVTNAGGGGGSGSVGSGNRGGGGGGGAAGPDGTGGTGGNGSGSAGGNPGTGNGGSVTGNGTDGTKWNDGTNSRGPGSGGRGGFTGAGLGAGTGGFYGAGGGGGYSINGLGQVGAAGVGGLIVVINNASL